MTDLLEDKSTLKADNSEVEKVASTAEDTQAGVGPGDASIPEPKLEVSDTKADEDRGEEDIQEINDSSEPLSEGKTPEESVDDGEGSEDSDEQENGEENEEPEIDESTPNGIIRIVVSRSVNDKAIQVMNSAPRESLRIARSGDVDMMRYVLAGIELIPPHLAGYACEAICHHLRFNPPLKLSDEIVKDEKLAILSMVTLFRFLDVFKTSDVVDTLRLSWKSTVRWMDYFTRKYLSEYAESDSGNLLEAVSGTLYFAMDMDRMLKKNICSDFAMNKLVVALWASSYSGADTRGYASLALTTVLEHSPSTAKMVQNILLQLCHIPDVITTKLFEERLAHAHDFRTLNAYASLAAAFCTEATEAMMYNMWKDDGIYQAGRALSIFLRDSPSPGDTNYEGACTAYAQVVTFVVRLLDCIVGQSIIGQALASDFLESLALLGPKFDSFRSQPIKRLVTRFLSEVLPRIMLRKEKTVYFLKAVGAALSPEIRPQVMESSFAEEWTFLELLVRERAAYELFFHRREDLGLILKTRACANPTCDKADTDKTFKLCAACKNVVYCSAQCQGAHWKTSHRVACKKLRENPGMKTEKRTYLESFNAYCVRRDVIRYLPGLRNLAEEEFPTRPFGQVGIDIDYTVVPPAFNVFLLESLTSDPDREIADQASRLHHRAQEGRDNSVLARVIRSTKVKPNFLKDTIDRTYTEVLINNAGEFNAERKGIGEKVPRLICQDDQSRELESVTYDRIDEFLDSLVPGGKTEMDNEVLAQITQNLKAYLDK